MGDSELIGRIRSGDTTAWTALMTAYQHPVFRLAYLLLGDADEAEDVAQDTFIRAFHALDRFDADRPLRPWLLRIAANAAHNRRRSLRRSLATLVRAWQAEPEHTQTIGERSGQQWEAQTLWQAVRRLGHREQEMIYLRYFLDLSEAEIAESLAIAPGTVKSRLHRAVGRLRAVVDAEFPSLREERKA